MARPLAAKLRIHATLKAKTPLHVGGHSDRLDLDMPLAVNGRGEFYIPGTSLAGVLRAWMERHLDAVDVDLLKLWGFQQGERGAASRVLVEDAVVTLPAGLSDELWDGVGIDRQWGSAARTIKFDRSILPRDTTFPLDLSVELPPEHEKPFQAAFGHLLQAVKEDGLVLGAAGTRGLGRLSLEGLSIRREDWSSAKGVLDFLKGESESAIDIPSLTKDSKIQRQPVPRLRITIDWRPAGPLMVKAGADGVAVDTLPMVSGSGAGKLAMVLPGSSLKGALRSQAERIMRTLLNTPDNWVGTDEKKTDRHLQQLDIPLVNTVFGSPRRGKGGNRTGSRGALTVDTCYAKTTMAPKCWREVTSASGEHNDPEPLQNALKTAGLGPDGANVQQAFHVAVDRWTGGAADSLLYSVLEPMNVGWESIEMELDLCRCWSGRDHSMAAVALLLLVLRDLTQSRIPLGFGVNRGYGSVEVTRVKFQMKSGEGSELAWLDGTTLAGLSSDVDRQSSLKDLQEQWRTWVENFPEASA